MPTQTLVTCLYDLARQEGGARKSLTFYLERLAFVLSLPLPLVLYVEPRVAEEPAFQAGLAQRRAESTSVVARGLETLPRFDLLPRLTSMAAFENAGATKDTPLYQIMNWAKIDLLVETAHHNPFKTGHFAWIDAAISHVANPPQTFPRPTDGVAVLQMRAVAPDEVTSRKEFYRAERGRIAGGFIRGSAARLEALRGAFHTELDAALSLDMRPNEQMVFSWLSATHPHLFEFYFGGYDSILCNCDEVLNGMGVIMYNLAHCRQYGLWSSTMRICQVIEASLTHGVLSLDDELRARWLDEYFIAAWYSHDIERCRSIAVALIKDCQQTAWFREHETRMRGNLCYLATSQSR